MLKKRKKPEWIKEATTRNADVVVAGDGTVHWLGGSWIDGCWWGGVWHGGHWHNGRWCGGRWMGGQWLNGNWGGGLWRGGKWFDGLWEGGTWEDGVWHDGVWRGGHWDGGVWKGGHWSDPTNDRISCHLEAAGAIFDPYGYAQAYYPSPCLGDTAVGPGINQGDFELVGAINLVKHIHRPLCKKLWLVKFHHSAVINCDGRYIKVREGEFSRVYKPWEFIIYPSMEAR